MSSVQFPKSSDPSTTRRRARPEPSAADCAETIATLAARLLGPAAAPDSRSCIVISPPPYKLPRIEINLDLEEAERDDRPQIRSSDIPIFANEAELVPWDSTPSVRNKMYTFLCARTFQVTMIQNDVELRATLHKGAPIERRQYHDAFYTEVAGAPYVVQAFQLYWLNRKSAEQINRLLEATVQAYQECDAHGLPCATLVNEALLDGVMLWESIPNPLELTWQPDQTLFTPKELSLLVQFKQIIQRAWEKNLRCSLRKSNFRVDADGKVVLCNFTKPETESDIFAENLLTYLETLWNGNVEVWNFLLPTSKIPAEISLIDRLRLNTDRTWKYP